MQMPPPPSKRPSFAQAAMRWALSHKVISSAVAILLVLGVIGALADPDEAESAAPPSSSATPSLSATPEPTVTPEPEIETTKVPRIIGLSAQEARSRIATRGLTVTVTSKYSKEPGGTVLQQSISAGSRVDEGTMVRLVVAKPFPRVPDLAGTKVRPAKQELRRAGFGVAVQLQESASAPSGTVLFTIPAAGTRVRPGAQVTLVVAKKPPPPPPQPSSNCHPSYTGACLDPSASDYDCAGGSGDGPKYTGFVRVVGYDEYGLDSDNDGLGCES